KVVQRRPVHFLTRDSSIMWSGTKPQPLREEKGPSRHCADSRPLRWKPYDEVGSWTFGEWAQIYVSTWRFDDVVDDRRGDFSDRQGRHGRRGRRRGS